MSNANYTRITDTAVSAPALLAALSPDEILGLNFQGTLAGGNLVSPTGAALALSGSNLVQAATNGLTINCLGTPLSQATKGLSLGGDTAANAAALLGLLQLEAVGPSGSAGNARLLKFNVLSNTLSSSSAPFVAPVALGNGSIVEPATYVQVISSTGYVGTGAPLFNGSYSGTTAYSTNVLAYSPSSGVIAFKILS